MKKWKSAIRNKNLSTDVDEISSTVESLLLFIEVNGVEAVNFEGLNMENANIEHLAAVLRITFPHRHLIEDYHYAFGIALLIDDCEALARMKLVFNLL